MINNVTGEVTGYYMDVTNKVLDKAGFNRTLVALDTFVTFKEIGWVVGHKYFLHLSIFSLWSVKQQM